MRKAVIFDLVGVLIELSNEKEVRVIEETFNFTKELKKNYKIGALSNLPTIYKTDLKKKGFYEIFSAVDLSGETGTAKPNKEAYFSILKKLDVKPEEALFVDDSYANIKGAEDIGMSVILYKDHEEFVKKFKEKENPFN